MEEYPERLKLFLNTCYTSSILLCILKENFKKPACLIFGIFCFHVLVEGSTRI